MGDTPLHLAAAAGSLNDKGRQEVLDTLLGLGASADFPNKVHKLTPYRTPPTCKLLSKH